MKGAVLATGAGILAGCAPKVAETAAPEKAPLVTGATATDWLGTEPEIHDVAETVESDVIVIGAGTWRQYVAASVLEKGLKVIVLEKNTTVSTLRNDWGSIGSKWQKAEGVEIDKAAAIHTHAFYSANRIDQRLAKIWADESGAAITWIGELLESLGGTFLYEGGYEPVFSGTTYPKFPTGHSAYFEDGCDGSPHMKTYIEGLGGEFRFETTFVKFEHEGKKVTAAIAKDKDGKYIRFVGKKVSY
jgi:succinate dehydrogenase/fumarate reductase flavoprotein subunit